MELHCGDCLDVLATLPADSIDSCVTDPPYGLEFMGKEWDKFADKPRRINGTGGREAPFDFQSFSERWALEVYRVLKPGAHLLAFGGTRTYHRMVCAIEDAGFEVRDTIMWLYGSGFPKSRNIGNGWGTALKPACEPIVLARKPLSEGTVAANVLKHGVGALNIDGCRVESEKSTGWNGLANGRFEYSGSGDHQPQFKGPGEKRPSYGRWPANVIHDGSEEVVGMFPESSPPCGSAKKTDTKNDVCYGKGFSFKAGSNAQYVGDSGSAARFFYCAKANKKERAGSKHPTVKPIKLLRYLVRLVTPPGGLVLDPFAGTGTTGEAAVSEGFRAVLIEREAEYQADIRRRVEAMAEQESML